MQLSQPTILVNAMSTLTISYSNASLCHFISGRLPMCMQVIVFPRNHERAPVKAAKIGLEGRDTRASEIRTPISVSTIE